MLRKKTEAIQRMKMLKLHSNAIKEFEEEGKLYLSENGGFLYGLDADQQQSVLAFEKTYSTLVYHVLHNFVGGDEHLAFLFVSDHEEEWEQDKEDLQQGYPFVYIKNVSADWCSEFGSIGIKPCIGGLKRTV